MSKVIEINRKPGDFIRATRHLSLEERGAYQDILDQIVEIGQDEEPPSLPDDDRVIANILGCTPGRWRAIKKRLCSGPLAVLVLGGGRISQARIVEEIEEARERIGGASRAGKASAAARAQRKSAELRERMSSGGSTDVATGVQREGQRNHQRNSNADPNGTPTIHESRITNHEERESVSIPATPVLPELPKDGVAATEFIQDLCQTLNPGKRPPDDFTVSGWFRDIHPDPWWIGAVICEVMLSLPNARDVGTYLTSILAQRKREGWTVTHEDAKGLVEFRLYAARRTA